MAARDYKRYPQNVKPALHVRHSSAGKLDTLTTREAVRRPYGAVPRKARDWN